MKKHLLAAVLVAGTLGVVSIPVVSQAALPGSNRKLTYIMNEYGFQPKAALKVRKGETITFTFINKGKIVHEAVVGTVAVQKEHEKEMAAMAGMAVSMADEPDRVAVAAGKTKTLTMKFDKAGSYEIGCHQPGHYQLGMKLALAVK